ncbi:uncharacterized protein (DUF302 family) [Paraburkholderia sp. GAS199]|uniref:DUF302 domain-containing protein n=1 Tax=Paraburkholderia sp. GAS199 TaxID=3035126 RepID=UPI003D1BF0ED
MSTSASESFALPPHVVSLTSRVDFATTLARLEAAFQSRHITLFAKVDQAKAASDSGTTLRPTVLLLFGNPAAGTPIMAANPHAAVELPLKVVVWQDNAGLVHVDYSDVTQLLTRDYGIDRALFEKLAQIPAMLRSVVTE